MSMQFEVKNKIIDESYLENISPVFKGVTGHKLAKIFMHIVALDRINWVYDRSCQYNGAAFAESLLKDLGVEYMVGNAERLQHLPEGAFITVSNHPYGGLDGIMMIDLIAGIRPDYKFMVNEFLSLVKTMDENFIKVTTKTAKREGYTATSLNGIRETLTRLHDGHPVGFFPSGAVSDFNLKSLRVRDREWQESILKLVQAANVPIVPIRFFNQNSLFFYFLGLIDWRIRSLRMPYELFNKKGQNPRIGIGEIITVEDQAKFPDYESLGKHLRDSIYNMPRPKEFVKKRDLEDLTE